MKKQSFLYGAGVLAAASILCKMMSAMLKIPLDRFFLHEEGIAIYQSAYSIYNVFLAICVTGIPIALSSLVAKCDDDEAVALCRSTSCAVTVFTSVCAVLLIAFSGPLAGLLSGGKEPLAQPSLIVLALSLPVMGITSSRRGYFQGKRDMTPSAISQLAESFIKVVFGIAVCAFAVKKGVVAGAAGAISGVALGAVGAAVVLEIFYRKVQDKPKAPIKLSHAAKVVKLSVPMTLGAFAFTAIMLADSLSVPKILSQSGIEVEERMKLLGYLTRANTVYNLPATIITAITASAVPAVSAAIASKDSAKISENAGKVVKLIFLVSVPAMLGMVLFSKEILSLLYSSSAHWELLAFAGVMTLIMPYVQATTAMLQTFGSVWVPIVVSMAGVALKCVLNFFFVGSFGIAGAPIATITAFLVVLVINSFLLSGKTKLKGIWITLLKIAVCAVVACGMAKGIYMVKESLLVLVISLCVAAVLYVAGILATGCIKREEFSSKQKEVG